MAAAAQSTPRIHGTAVLAWAVNASFRPLHGLIAAPAVLFLATLGLTLFHPPDFHFHSIDRVVFGLLILVVLLRACVLRHSHQFFDPITWPMLGLLALAFYGTVSQTSDAEAWSLFAAKWFVPFVLYHLAAYLFRDSRSLQRFETFSLIVLAYLSLTASFFLFDADQLIFPRYILDPGIGIHIDRARGPFLQAVANGVALNLLGLIALNSFRRGRLRGVFATFFLVTLPVAIVATKTRAVWLSFAASVVVLLLFSPSQRLRRACLGLVLAGTLALAATVLIADHDTSLGDRLEERGPVMFRMAIYQSGWEMFLDKPLTGWGATAMQTELSKRISDFHQEQFFFHNTYLEIVVQYGLVGLLLYLWIMFDLIKLGRSQIRLSISEDSSFLDQEFRALWPLLLGVYVLNGSLVVMNYQFVNGFLFSVAGLLAAQDRRSAEADLDAVTG